MTDRSDFQLTVLGPRGSVPVSGPQFETFGGATSCYLVQAGEETVFLDAGSGLLQAPSDFPHDPLILLSHLHLDHVLGLGMYPRLTMRGKGTRICVPAGEGEDAKTVLDRLYSPPFWPLSLADCAGDVAIAALEMPMQIGELRVESVEGCHPGGCRAFRLSYRGRSLVYATDFEHEEEAFCRLADFAAGTDLLLYDGQFTEADYALRKGFGHSTAEKGLELKERCGAKQLLLIHHAPSADDAALFSREAAISRTDVRFARAGETIKL